MATDLKSHLALYVDPNTQLKQLVMQSRYLYNVKEDVGIIFNEATGTSYEMTEKALRTLLGAGAFADFQKHNYLMANFIYNPFGTKPLGLDENDIPVFNCYQPPAWQRDHFYKQEPLPAPSAQLPEVYDSFFRHFVDGDQESYDYLLDWLATALTSRNLTILTAIGEEGIGKGVLGEIMERLFGTTNYVRCRDEVFKAKFNGQLRNKRLVYIDEVALENEEQYNRLKDMVNGTIELERKGVDAEAVPNFASFYLSSNNYDAIRPSAGDRRFSALQLTDTKLVETPLIKRVDELLQPANVAALAAYLRGRTVTRDMLKPFRTRQFDRIMEASLAEWEYHVLYDWAPQHVGKVTPLRDLQEYLKEELDLRSAPGRNKIAMLCERFPKFLKMKKTNRGTIRLIEVVKSPLTDEELKAELELKRPAQAPQPAGSIKLPGGIR